MCWSWFKTSSRQKIGLILLLVGVSFFALAFLWQRAYQFQQDNLSFSSFPEVVTEIKEEDLPERILIPQVRIDLPVLLAKVTDNRWEVSEEGASYLLGSGIPGKEGNVVIYGHNKNSLFGPIRWVERETEIKIVNKRGEEFIYKIVETKTVSPDSIDILSATQDPVLTLYTCTGFLDSQRHVVRAKLQLAGE